MKKKLFITDLNGQQIEISGLKAALAQAKEFAGYKLVPETAFSERQRRYWTHFYEELQKLQTENETGKCG